MYFANSWGLLALLALPVILAIHLFRQRFPPLLVAGAHLWGVETRVTAPGRTMDRLPVTATLLLELLAALLLTAGISQPRIGADDEVAHVVAVLDDSASMQARAGIRPSPRESAIEELAERVEGSGTRGVVTLIRSGPQPTLLGARGMTWGEARAALSEWRPSAPQHDFAASWDEAAQVAGPDGEFLFLTDDLPTDTAALPQRMEVLAVGRSLENLALSAARWTYDSETGRGVLFLRIANYGERGHRVQVRGRSGSALLFEQAIDVAPGGETPLQTELPGGLGRLQVDLSAEADALEIDNRVVLVEPKVRTVDVALGFDAEAEEREPVQRVLTALPDVQPVAERADLWIGPAHRLPAAVAEVWAFGIGPLDPTDAALEEADTVTGPYILDKRHSLLDGVTLEGVIWGGIQPVDVPLRPLIVCDRRPLLALLEDTASPAYLMNIDLSRSNLTRSVDWPVLLANLIELRRDELPGLRRWNYRLDEVVALRLPVSEESEEDELILRTPAGDERLLVRDRHDLVEITRLQTPGIYRIEEGDAVRGEFAVNFFDPRESSLLGITPGRRVPQIEARPTTLRIDDPYTWLILLAVLLVLAALLLDWYVVRLRRTPAMPRT